MITTMRQIAEYSGYSITAVSNALNGTGLNSDETRNNIIDAAMELGYQHHSIIPTPVLSDAELGWLAGIIDGEGCITITATNPSIRTTHRTVQYRPYVTVTMGHKATIYRIGKLFGFGSTGIMRLSKNPKWNDAYKWYASSRQAILATEMVRPYLITKAEEADIILEWAKLPNLRTGRKGIPVELLDARENLFDRIRLLKPKNNTEHRLLARV